MKIGIFSGTFDPFHQGHEWIVRSCYKDYDQFIVLVGWHPDKNPAPVQERIALIKEKVNVDVETYDDLKDYLQKFKDDEVTLIRGIRNELDFAYEEQINNWHLTKPAIPNLKSIYLIPPRNLMQISSSKIKAEVSSLFETTTAGFAPVSEMQSFKDRIQYKPCKEITKAQEYYNLCLKAGIIKLADCISGDQVRQTLDSCPVDVVTSEIFHLEEVDISKITVFEGRYQSHTTSCGPIMVDVNYFDPYKSPIVIEGKHRFLDARERGDKTILAYVGHLVKNLT